MTSPVALKIYAASYQGHLINKVRAMLFESDDQPLFMELSRQEILEAATIGVVLEVVTKTKPPIKSKKITVVSVDGSPYVSLTAKLEAIDNLGEVARYKEP